MFNATKKLLAQFILAETPHFEHSAPSDEVLMPKDVNRILRIAEKLNEVSEWNISKSEFIKAEASKPAWPDAPHHLVAPVLVPYITAHHGFSALGYTMHEIWNVIGHLYLKEGQEDTYALPDVIRDKEHCNQFDYLDGINPIVGSDPHNHAHLRWEVVDFRRNVGKTVQQVRSVTTSPALAVFAALMYFPTWGKHMSEKGDPNVAAPGIRRLIMDPNSTDFVPIIEHNNHTGTPGLKLLKYDYAESGLSIPEYYKAA